MALSKLEWICGYNKNRNNSVLNCTGMYFFQTNICFGGPGLSRYLEPRAPICYSFTTLTLWGICIKHNLHRLISRKSLKKRFKRGGRIVHALFKIELMLEFIQVCTSQPHCLGFIHRVTEFKETLTNFIIS